MRFVLSPLYSSCNCFGFYSLSTKVVLFRNTAKCLYNFTLRVLSLMLFPKMFGTVNGILSSAPTFGEIVPKLGNSIGFGDKHGEIGFLGETWGNFSFIGKKVGNFHVRLAFLFQYF